MDSVGELPILGCPAWLGNSDLEEMWTLISKAYSLVKTILS